MPPPIRRAVSSDGPALARLRWDFRVEEGEIPLDDFPEFLVRFLEHYWHGLDTATWSHWIVEDDGAIVGYMAVQVHEGVPRPAAARDRWGWLTECYTVPAARNQGHGSRLLEEIHGWAAAEGLELVLVSPSERAIPFYEHAGYRPAVEWLQISLERRET